MVLYCGDSVVKFGVADSLMRILNESLGHCMSLLTSCFDLVCLFFLFATVVLLLFHTVVGEGVIDGVSCCRWCSGCRC